METRIIERLNPELECVNLLECYYTHNKEKVLQEADVIDSCEKLRNTLRLDRDDYGEMFDAVIEVYRHVTQAFDLNDPLMKRFFTIPSDFMQNSTSLAALIYDTERLIAHFPDIKDEDRQMLQRAHISTCASIDEVDVESFRSFSFVSDYVRGQNLPDGFKLHLLDLCMTYDQCRETYRVLIEKAVKRFNEKSYLLEPQVNALYQRLETELDEHGSPTEASPMYMFAANENVIVCPSTMRFGEIFSGIYKHLGPKYGAVKEIVYYGVLYHEISRRFKARREAGDCLSECLKAISDKKKLQIMDALRVQPRYAQDLVRITELSAATISHHMSELMISSLVKSEKQGTRILYSIQEKNVRDFLTLLENHMLPLRE